MNVVLQSFIANPLLRSYFLSDKHNCFLCDVKPGCTACEFDKLFMQVCYILLIFNYVLKKYIIDIKKVYQPDNLPLGPISLLHNLWTAPGASDLAGYAQQDAHEAYISRKQHLLF